MGPLAVPPPTVRAMPAGNPARVFFHFDFLRSLQLHRALAIGIFSTAVLLASAYVLRMWPIYMAQSLVYIQPAPPRLIAKGTSNRLPYDSDAYESYIQQQIHNITRPDVLLGALHKLPAISWRTSAETEQAAADRLGKSIEVARVGTGYQVSITARNSNATLAAQVSNSVASSFIESATRELRSGDTQLIELLHEEGERLLKELAADREEQEDLNRKLGGATVGASMPDPFDEQIRQVRAELIKARAANDEAAARLTSIATGGSASTAALNAEADEIVSADPGMVGSKTALNQRRSVIITQMANLAPNHPQYKQDAEELAQINASLEAMNVELRSKAETHFQQRLKTDLERTSAVEAQLNARLAQLTAAASGASPRLQRSNELAGDIQRLQNRYASVDKQYRNLTTEDNAPGAVYLSAAAVPPIHATNSGVLRNAMVVVFAGLLLGIAAAVTANNLDPHVYTSTDVERILGFAPMSQLPDFAQVSEGVAEECTLRLAVAIENAYQQGGLQSCVFTGVTPGAGVTTVVTRVRTLLEAMGRSTVLVDASGTAAADASSPAGSDATTELMTKQRGSRSTALLQKVAEETGEETIVLADSSPVLISGETEDLARFIDSAIIVIESGVTTRAQLRDVASTLRRLEVAAAGVVLNRIDLAKADPTFLHSVRSVERHLKAQDQSYAHGTAIGRPSEPLVQETARKPSSAGPSASVGPFPPFPGEQSSPVTGKTPADPISTPSAASRIVDAGDKVVPRLTPRPLRGREPAPSASPQPASSAAQQMAQVRSSTSLPVEQPAAQPSRQFADAPSPAPPVRRATEPPAVELAPPVPVPARRAPDIAAASQVELEDLPYSAASRLGGLRVLLVSLGIQSMEQELGLRAPELETGTRPSEQVERPVYAQPLAQTGASSTGPSIPSSAAVTAEPEFLPPNPGMESAERKLENVMPATPTPHRDQANPSEEVQTLPSWRGQYRKRRL